MDGFVAGGGAAAPSSSLGGIEEERRFRRLGTGVSEGFSKPLRVNMHRNQERGAAQEQCQRHRHDGSVGKGKKENTDVAQRQVRVPEGVTNIAVLLSNNRLLLIRLTNIINCYRLFYCC